MKIRPLQDRILVKRMESEEKTVGGIIIPDNAKEKPMEGKVVAVGNGKLLDDGKFRKPDVKVGDRIGSDWIIEDGVKPGERVVTDGLFKIAPGMQVNPKGAK